MSEKKRVKKRVRRDSHHALVQSGSAGAASVHGALDMEMVDPIFVKALHAESDLIHQLKPLGRASVWRVLLVWRGSAVFGVWKRLVWAVLVSLLLALLNEPGLFRSDGEAVFAPRLEFRIFQLVGVPLSFLVVFRSNLSYKRYWAGVDRLGQLVVGARNVVRQVLAYGKLRPPLKKFGLACRVARLQAVFLHVVRKAARGELDYHELSELCTARELEVLQKARGDRVSIVGLWLSQSIRHFGTPPPVMKMFEESVHSEMRAWRGIQRISQSQFPFAYRQLLQVGLSLYIWASPLALMETLGLWTPLVVFLLAMLFYGIDQVGEELSDPFGVDPSDLPLYSIIRATQIDMAGILRAYKQSYGDDESLAGIEFRNTETYLDDAPARPPILTRMRSAVLQDN